MKGAGHEAICPYPAWLLSIADDMREDHRRPVLGE
jgi:hypothetical protein